MKKERERCHCCSVAVAAAAVVAAVAAVVAAIAVAAAAATAIAAAVAFAAVAVAGTHSLLLPSALSPLCSFISTQSHFPPLSSLSLSLLWTALFVPIHSCLLWFVLMGCAIICARVGCLPSSVLMCAYTARPLAGPLVFALLFVCMQVPIKCKN